MTAPEWIVAIAGAGLGTYALRAAPFLWAPWHRLADRYLRFLTFVSLAIAAGIVARAIVFSSGQAIELTEIAIKAAAVCGALVLYRLSRNLLLALFAGVALAMLLKVLVT